MTVSGDTHQSEHPIGFEPLAHGSDLSDRGGSAAAKELENQAPAYQETYALHRAHIGTGNRGDADESGMNADAYRTAQRRLLEDGHPVDAIQLNQLAYTGIPGFADRGPAATAADDSYQHMVANLSSVTHAGPHGARTTTPVAPIDRVTARVARHAAKSGQWPDRRMLAHAWIAEGYVPTPEDDVDGSAAAAASSSSSSSSTSDAGGKPSAS